ncbi:helix-turn-helix transcriptional regulator [Prauserella oleivorans]|uniref:Helix-turn-helix transcriptional regulator n=1 Tax=Prauserella oleivorans TaxID=1478153 RepID=A0ABW5WI17_9PSEU
MSGSVNLLGDYLRARRELVTPEQVGLPQIGIRRVPGLRREEVAMLAGISADYYLRLEQGRDRSASRQVLESLARVLRLDDDGAEYLLSLAQPGPRTPRRRPHRETVPTGIRILVDAIGFPAFVEGRYFDVLAANPAAAALSPRLVVGNNRLRDVFLDPAEQALYPAWDEVTARLVAGFRSSVGVAVEDQRFVDLVGSLSIASPRFRELWGRQDVARREGATMSVEHPVVGELTLFREKLPITGTNGQMLVIYHPEPGSRDADKLTLLISSELPSLGSPSRPDIQA